MDLFVIQPAPARPNVPRSVSKVLPVTPTTHANPKKVTPTKIGTRPLPGTSVPSRKTRNHNRDDATAYIAALAKESISSPDKPGTDLRSPVDILRVGSDCGRTGRPLRFSPTHEGLGHQCAARFVYILILQH